MLMNIIIKEKIYQRYINIVNTRIKLKRSAVINIVIVKIIIVEIGGNKIVVFVILCVVLLVLSSFLIPIDNRDFIYY